MADQGSPPVAEPLTPPPARPERPEGRAEARRVFNVMLLYIGVVFIVAAVIAPWLYAAVHRFAPDSYLADQPFHRYVNRCMIGLALLGLLPLLKELRLKFSAADLGLRPRNFPDLLVGFLWGFGIMALVGALTVGFGARTPDFDHTAAEWLKHLKNAALAGLLVGVVEELLFRGALFAGLRRNDTFASAALVSSLLYAIVHFFERPDNPRHIEWNSGMLVLAEMLRGFADWQALIPGLLNLTLLGLILCLALERTRSLLFSIGLHASIVFWLKSLNFLTDNTGEADAWIWGGGKIVDGWISFGLLAGLLVFMSRTLRRNG